MNATQEASSETQEPGHCNAGRCIYCGSRQRLYGVTSPTGYSSRICSACWQIMAAAGKSRRPAQKRIAVPA